MTATIWRQHTVGCETEAARAVDWTTAEIIARALSAHDGGVYVATADGSPLRAEFRGGVRAP